MNLCQQQLKVDALRDNTHGAKSHTFRETRERYFTNSVLSGDDSSTARSGRVATVVLSSLRYVFVFIN